MPSRVVPARSRLGVPRPRSGAGFHLIPTDPAKPDFWSTIPSSVFSEGGGSTRACGTRGCARGDAWGRSSRSPPTDEGRAPPFARHGSSARAAWRRCAFAPTGLTSTRTPGPRRTAGWRRRRTSGVPVTTPETSSSRRYAPSRRTTRPRRPVAIPRSRPSASRHPHARLGTTPRAFTFRSFPSLSLSSARRARAVRRQPREFRRAPPRPRRRARPGPTRGRPRRPRRGARASPGSSSRAERRRREVAARYRPLHPDVYVLLERHVDSRWRQLADMAREALAAAESASAKKPSARDVLLARATAAGVLRQRPRGVFAFPALSLEFCRALREEVAHFEQSGFEPSRPNTMNTNGLLLYELGAYPRLLDPSSLVSSRPSPRRSSEATRRRLPARHRSTTTARSPSRTRWEKKWTWRTTTTTAR